MQAFPVIGTWTAASLVREMLVALVVMLRLVLVLVMVQLQTVGRWPTLHNAEALQYFHPSKSCSNT